MTLSEIKKHLSTAEAVNFILPTGAFVPEQLRQPRRRALPFGVRADRARCRAAAAGPGAGAHGRAGSGPRGGVRRAPPRTRGGAVGRMNP